MSFFPASAQQSGGTPGSPGATTTVDGKYLSPPPPKFGGEINLQASQSKPYWTARVVPPQGAPNTLLIMTDDQGCGVSGTFGGGSDTCDGPHRAHPVPLCGTMFTDAGGSDYGPQPPFCWVWHAINTPHSVP